MKPAMTEAPPLESLAIQPKLSIFGIIAAKKMVIVKIMVIFTQSYIYMV